jgi:hypothetical protein
MGIGINPLAIVSETVLRAIPRMNWIACLVFALGALFLIVQVIRRIYLEFRWWIDRKRRVWMLKNRIPPAIW